MRRFLPLLAAPALMSATIPADPVAQARAEAEAAEREAQRLSAAAQSAESEAARLRSAQEAAAASILAAEARISAAALRQSALQRLLEKRRVRLAREQRPAALLLAGLAQMGRRPPLLALADGGSVEDFVRMRALIGAVMPEVRRRSAGLAADIRQGEQLAAEAASLRSEQARTRQQLRAAQSRFAALEQQAIARSAALGADALDAGDTALARSEQATGLQESGTRGRAAARMAAQLAALAPAPPRPGSRQAAQDPPLDYQLPVPGRVLTGLSEISDNGVRSRGLQLEAGRGAMVAVPANGRIAFAGPFRSREGVVIIDHGGGWMTLLTEVRTSLKAGEPVVKGALLGRALGDVTVELSKDGRPQPVALIARSSHLLSNGRHSG